MNCQIISSGITNVGGGTTILTISDLSHIFVLATVDESTYKPDSELKMGGDHPVIWSNENVKARNVYIFMGHRAEHFQNPVFTQLFHNAILWAAQK